MHPRDQTIFALATGPLPSAIAVVRISGPLAGEVLIALTGSLPAPRFAKRALLLGTDNQPIDDGLALWFPAPHSATGEDIAELHIHGSRAVLAALIARLAEFADVRAAEPGEFTRRAFENGKLDLTEAEGLDDLIHADTEAQRRQALRQLGGLLGDKARHWRAQIIEASALITAGIDFSDEGDVAGELIAPARAIVAGLIDEIEDVLKAEGRSERLREGLVVAIAGPPNVGKSTLINRLARREVAIVSPHAGTTRDIIEVQLDLGGYPVTLIDTAGIRDSDDPVEQEGVRRARTRAAEADLVLWLGAKHEVVVPAFGDRPVWRIRTKIDLDVEPGRHGGKGQVTEVGWADTIELQISAVRGDGIGYLLERLTGFASAYFGSAEAGAITRQRHRDLLQLALHSLRRSIHAELAEELVAEDLRLASDAVARLLGRIDIEDILGEIFGRFCIGK